MALCLSLLGESSGSGAGLVLVLLGVTENRNPEVEGYSYVNLVMPKNVSAAALLEAPTRRASWTFAEAGEVRAGSWDAPGR